MVVKQQTDNISGLGGKDETNIDIINANEKRKGPSTLDTTGRERTRRERVSKEGLGTERGQKQRENDGRKRR